VIIIKSLDAPKFNLEVETKKKTLNPLFWAKKPQKPKKNPLGWVKKKKSGFFPTLGNLDPQHCFLKYPVPWVP
jgi:hypothetical protein